MAPQTAYDTARRKMESIEKENLPPGSVVVISTAELNAWVEREAPDGVRRTHIEPGQGRAWGSALVDFVRLRRAQGVEPGWLFARLLEGERQVGASVRIRSAEGRATVDVDRVEISGIAIAGRMLEFLIDAYIRPHYPDAKVGEPFELGHRMQRIDVQPGLVRISIGQ